MFNAKCLSIPFASIDTDELDSIRKRILCGTRGAVTNLTKQEVAVFYDIDANVGSLLTANSSDDVDVLALSTIFLETLPLVLSRKKLGDRISDNWMLPATRRGSSINAGKYFTSLFSWLHYVRCTNTLPLVRTTSRVVDIAIQVYIILYSRVKRVDFAVAAKCAEDNLQHALDRALCREL